MPTPAHAGVAPPPPAIAAAQPPLAPPPVPAVAGAAHLSRSSEILRAARLTLESRFADVRVEGEISGLKRSGPGHLYFCLKDDEAQLDCVLFSREAGRLKFRSKRGWRCAAAGA